MSKDKQFRIKYYDYEDSKLYNIIQMAPNEPCALLNAEERLKISDSNFIIVEVEEIDTSEHYIEEIRKILSTSIERDEFNWQIRKRRMTG